MGGRRARRPILPNKKKHGQKERQRKRETSGNESLMRPRV